MALVAYGNSDSSEYEDDEDENASVVTLTKALKVAEPSISKHPLENGVEEAPLNEDSPLFTRLPQPTSKKPAVIEEDDEFLHKKENANIVKPKAKITVPSLSDFKDVEDRPTVKPKTTNGKKSGLLSMLPQPKNAVTITTKSLIPNILTKKPNTTAKKKDSLPTPLKKAKMDKNTSVSHYSDESDNEDDVETDFFSINKPIDLPEDVPLEEPIKKVNETNTAEQKTFNIQSYFKQDEVQNDVEAQPAEMSSTTEYYSGTSYGNEYGAPEGSSSSGAADVLDEEAILKLCGTRGKRKREDIRIVDVNQREVLADAREWLLKGLMDDTSKRVSASKRRGDEPTSQQRRKHQITYLAHQAKANEAELQNQWANSRMSRRQTQSKYGF